MNKAKEPIKIRFRKLKGGSKSIYLDCYWEGKRSYESLNLYVIPEKTDNDKEINKETLKAANKIKAERIISLVHKKAKIKDNDSSKMLFTDLLTEFKEDHQKKGNYIHQISQTIDRIKEFSPKVKLCEIDKQYCIDWLDYIQNVYVSEKRGRHLSPGGAKVYEKVMVLSLNYAVRNEYIDRNPFTLVPHEYRVKIKENQRTYLTEEEFNAIKNTASNNPVVKQAFLFECYCGLRISDIRLLTWNNIVINGDSVRIEKTIQKTQKPISIPLCQKAIDLLPPRGNKKGDDLVFDLPGALITINRHITQLGKDAGLSKKVTTHVGRHTFATLLLSKNANITAIRDLLGHTNIQTTMIYAKIIDKQKIDTINLLNNV